MSVLVVAEVQSASPGGPPSIAPITHELLGIGGKLAAQLGDRAHPQLAAALVGSGVGALASDLAPYGADRVYVADAPALASYLAESYVPAIASAIGQERPKLVLLGHTAIGRELGPRLAYRLGRGIVTDCTSLRVEQEGPGLVITKPVYGGSAVAEFAPADASATLFVTIRPRVFEPLRQETREVKVIQLDVAQEPTALRTRVVDTVQEAAVGPRLKDAKVVVAGGRGVGGPENWHYVEELVAVLGAAAAASRAVTDAGWVSPSLQVGLTGTSVTPDLYIAVGISGAVQHLAGCSGARNIVAINRDPNANIFKYARYGVAADWRQVLPAFIERVEELRGAR